MTAVGKAGNQVTAGQGPGPAAGCRPYTALVLLAEIGDITRFGPARKLAARAGLATVEAIHDLSHARRAQIWSGLRPATRPVDMVIDRAEPAFGYSTEPMSNT